MKTRSRKPTITPHQTVVLAIRNRISDEFAEEVIRKALSHAPNAAPKARRYAEDILRQESGSLNVPGFRDAARAMKDSSTIGVLLGRILDNFRVPIIFEMILVLWEDANIDLKNTIRQYLHSHAIPVRDDILSDELQGEWDDSIAIQHAHDVADIHPQITFDEAALMLFCQSARALKHQAVDSAQNADNEPPSNEPLDWEPLMLPWLGLECNAQEWEAVDTFVIELRKLAARKQAERHSAREDLATALVTLTAQPDQPGGATLGLEYFGLSTEQWSASACPEAAVTPTTQSIQALVDHLGNYADAHKQPEKDAASRRQKNDVLTSLEDQITSVFTQIDALLKTPEPNTDEPGPATGTPVRVDDGSDPDEAIPSTDQEATDKLQPTDLGDDVGSIDTGVTAPIPPAAPQQSALPEPAEAPATSTPNDKTNTCAPCEDANGADPGTPLQPAKPIERPIPTLNHRSAEDQETNPACPPASLDAIHAIGNERSGPTPIRYDHADECAEVWNLLAREDYTGAYILSSSLETEGNTTPLPSVLIATLQGALWLGFDTVVLRDDIQSIASSGFVPPNDADARRLGMAAVLLPAIVSHNNVFTGWMAGITEYGAVGKVLESVREFTLCNQGLRAVDCKDGASPAQRKLAVQETSSRAARWLRDARSVNHDIIQARKVWERLLRADSDLVRLLGPVAENSHGDIAAVRLLLEKYERREDVQRLITDIGRSLHRGSAMILAGERRDATVRDIQTAVSLARDWCALIQADANHDKDWFSRVAQQLLDNLRTAVPRAYAELEAQNKETDAGSTRIATACLQRSLSHLADTLSLNVELTPALPLLNQPARDWWIFDERAREEPLTSALNRRLLWFPEEELAKDTSTQRISPPSPGHLCAALPSRPPTLESLEVALQQWREHGDFRFEDLILAAITDEQYALSLRVQGERIAETTRNTVLEIQKRAALENERALIHGVLIDEQYTENDEDLNATLLETRNLRRSMVRIRQVEQKVQDAKRKRSQAQLKTWTDLEHSLSQTAERSWLDNIKRQVENHINQDDVQIADSMLADLRALVESGQATDIHQPLDTAWDTERVGEASAGRGRPPVIRSPLEDFIRCEKLITDSLRNNNSGSLTSLVHALQYQKHWNGLEFKNVSKLRLKEAVNAVNEWKAFKQKRPTSIENVDLVALETIIEYLGFGRNRASDPLRIKNTDRDWIHVTARMTVAQDSVRSIPQFGSVGEINGYHIVCFWDRLEPVAISARLDSLRLNSESVLLFYLGNLTLQQRASFAEMARKRKASFAVLDETLLAFLALQRDNRLRAFLQCTLPFSAPNPYTPDRAGAVPREMFFGRTDMVKRLMDPEGSCIVYGGRQLGKSALLVDTQRQFNAPEQHRYAWIDDIRLTGTSSICIQPPTSLYTSLFDRFVKLQLLKPPAPKTSSDTLTVLREALLKRPDHRILVMFDEADNFLDADAANNFPIVTSLRQLMDATNRRFKVVFAGLHHVQRFRHYSNQPLTHFGEPILVGPLPPQHAVELVREPLECLGFQVSDPEVMTVLSYTNRHPGLIQKYCFELLSKLHNMPRPDILPTAVERRTVESVYLDPFVRTLITTRFEDTLNLDDRYRMIAYAMISEQMSDRDSYARVFHDHEILEIVKCYASQLFANTNSDGMRFLLDEMCGLGVLIHVHQTGYRLRSPNLVRLLGTEQAISQRLEELASKPVSDSADSESLHAPLSPTLKEYSPLTRNQEIGLNSGATGVGLIFASEAQGLGRLPDALRAFLPEEMLRDDRPRAIVAVMPSRYTGEAEVKQWLTDTTHTYRSLEHLILHQTVPQKTGVEKRVRTAIQFCRDYSPRSASAPIVQVYFLFNDEATAGWLALSRSDREELENAAIACTWPRPWTPYAIWQRLVQLDISSDITKTIFAETGGWPLLVESAFARLMAALPHDAGHRSQLSHASLAAAINEFKRKVPLHPNSPAWHVWRFILHEQGQTGVPPELIEVDHMTQAECGVALVWLERMGCIERTTAIASKLILENGSDPSRVPYDLVRTNPFIAACFAGELD